MNTSKLSADAKLSLHWVVNLAGNGAIIGILPTLLPTWTTSVIFLLFNLAMVTYAFLDPSYAVHLIQTGQLSVPPVPPQK
jgi:hypothetical protein